MSQPEKKASELIMERLDKLQSEIESLKTFSTKEISKAEAITEDHEEKSIRQQGHQTLEDMLKCPNCYPKVRDAVLEKEKPVLAQSIRDDLTKGLKERIKKDFVCTTCGTGVDRDESECPTCHGKDARRR